MQALVKYAPGEGSMEVRNLPEPEPGPGQVKLKVAFAGICGSDLHIRSGAMELKSYPLVLGHEMSGIIAAVGPGVQRWHAGEQVTVEHTFSICGHCTHCRQGEYQVCPERRSLGFDVDGVFAEYVVVAASMLHRVPEHVPMEAAALCEPLACAVHAVTKAHITWGDEVLVIGPGPIGQLVSQVAKAAGATVTIVGTLADKNRLEVAKGMGTDRVLAGDKPTLTEAILDLTGGHGPGVVLECSGASSGAALGLEVIRRRGTYVQVGLFGRPVELPYDTVLYKELTVRGTFCHNWHDWEKALALLSAGKIEYQSLITAYLPLCRWEEGFEMLRNRQGLKVLLTPQEDGEFRCER
ncbi:zinc-binding dehydrogenase [Moorellaceae bacterium AZ2]